MFYVFDDDDDDDEDDDDDDDDGMRRREQNRSRRCKRIKTRRWERVAGQIFLYAKTSV